MLSVKGVQGNRERMLWMDSLRGAAILAVIVYHAEGQVSVSQGLDVPVLSMVDQALDPFRVPILMLMSGMLVQRSLRKGNRAYVGGKLRKIGWPYLVWSAAMLGLLAVTAPITGNRIRLADFLRIFYSPPTYHWYLAFLLVFYLAALVTPAAVLTAATVPLFLITAFLPTDDSQRFWFLAGCFLTGDVLTRHWSAVEPVINRVWVQAVGLLLAIAAGIAATRFELKYEILWLPSLLGAVFGLRPLLEKCKSTIVGRLLAVVGRQSLVYYVSHFMIIILGYHVAIRSGLQLDGLPLTVLLVVLALLGGVLLVWLRSRLLVNWLFEWPDRSKARAPASNVTTRREDPVGRHGGHTLGDSPSVPSIHSSQ